MRVRTKTGQMAEVLSEEGGVLVDDVEDHQINESVDGNTIYNRHWSGDGTGIIKKMVKTTDAFGNTWTRYHASGTWADRATLTYVANDIVI